MRTRPQGLSPAIVTLLFLLAGCGQNTGQVDDTAGSPDCQVELDPASEGSMTLTPSTAAPGARIKVSYPTTAARGSTLLMMEVGVAECHLDYVLSTDVDGPRWKAIDQQHGNVGVGSILRSLSSHPAVVPDVAEPGVYRLCGMAELPSETDNHAQAQACALLTVR